MRTPFEMADKVWAVVDAEPSPVDLEERETYHDGETSRE
jgi:hypothetical protein